MLKRTLRTTLRPISSCVRLIFNLLTFDWLFSHRLEKSQLRATVDRPRSSFRIISNRMTITGWAINDSNKEPAPVRTKLLGQTFTATRSRQKKSSLPADMHDVDERNLRFSISLKIPLGVRKLSVEAQDSHQQWIVIRNFFILVIPKVRFRGGSWARRLSYGKFVKQKNKALNHVIFSEKQRHAALMIEKPTFSIIIVADQSQREILKTLASIQEQLYQPHEVFLSGDDRSPIQGHTLQATKLRWLQLNNLKEITGSHCIFIEAGDRLHAHALYEFASAMNAEPGRDIIYADEDTIDERGLFSNPFFKPDWSPDYLEVFNYMEFPCCYRTKLVIPGYQNHCLYDLALRSTEQSERVYHIPKVLGHRHNYSQKTADQTKKNVSGSKALQARLSRTGRKGVVSSHKTHRGCFFISPQLTREPLLSIVIPTAGKTRKVQGKDIDLLPNLVSQIFELSSYRNKEVIVVDSGSLSNEQTQTLQNYHCKIVSDREQQTSIARKINIGARESHGEYVLILNDDIEVLTRDWLERMLWHFEKPNVGVVGCRLVYPEGTIQHVGVVFVAGHPEHVRRRKAGDEGGYFFSSCAPRNYMAVTGACMMTPRNVFIDAGGYDEEFPFDYNDVSYCLTLYKKGLRTVCDNGIALMHLESASRASETANLGSNRFEELWAAEVVTDPFYNNQFLNLSKPAFIFEKKK